MKLRFISLLVAAVVMALPGVALAELSSQTMLAMVNRANPVKSISIGEAKRMLTGKTTMWPGSVKIRVFLRKSNSEGGEVIEKITDSTITKVYSGWSEKALSGRGARPKFVDSAAEAAELVTAYPGGISFISGPETNLLSLSNAGGVKLIEVK